MRGAVPEKENDEVLKGTVVAVGQENGSIRITVDIGQKIQVLMPEDRYRRQPFQVLQEIGLRIPRQAVELLP